MAQEKQRKVKAKKRLVMAKLRRVAWMAKEI